MAAVRQNHDLLMKEMLASVKNKSLRSSDAAEPLSVSAGGYPSGSGGQFADDLPQATVKIRREGVASRAQVRVSVAEAEPRLPLSSPAATLSSSAMDGNKKPQPATLQPQVSVFAAMAVRLGPQPYISPLSAGCGDGEANQPLTNKLNLKPDAEILFAAIPVMTSSDPGRPRSRSANEQASQMADTRSAASPLPGGRGSSRHALSDENSRFSIPPQQEQQCFGQQTSSNASSGSTDFLPRGNSGTTMPSGGRPLPTSAASMQQLQEEQRAQPANQSVAECPSPGAAGSLTRGTYSAAMFSNLKSLPSCEAPVERQPPPPQVRQLSELFDGNGNANDEWKGFLPRSSSWTAASPSETLSQYSEAFVQRRQQQPQVLGHPRQASGGVSPAAVSSLPGGSSAVSSRERSSPNSSVVAAQQQQQIQRHPQRANGSSSPASTGSLTRGNSWTAASPGKASGFSSPVAEKRQAQKLDQEVNGGGGSFSTLSIVTRGALWSPFFPGEDSPLSPQFSPVAEQQPAQQLVPSANKWVPALAPVKGNRGVSGPESSSSSSKTGVPHQPLKRSVSCQAECAVTASFVLKPYGDPSRKSRGPTQQQHARPALSSSAWTYLSRADEPEIESEEARASVSELIDEWNQAAPRQSQSQPLPKVQPLQMAFPALSADSLGSDIHQNGRSSSTETAVRSPRDRKPSSTSGGYRHQSASSLFNEEHDVSAPLSPTKHNGWVDRQGAAKQLETGASVAASRVGVTSNSPTPGSKPTGYVARGNDSVSSKRLIDALREQKILGTCAKCDEPISANLGGCMSMGKKYHVGCLLCCRCGKELVEQTFYTVENNPHCRHCFTLTLESCGTCGEVITSKLIRAAGRAYHLACFTCAACSRPLEGEQFVLSPEGEAHCLDDYYEKYAPKCDGCNKPIIPEEGEESALQVRVFNRCFHVSCCKCEVCGKVILSQSSDEAACYPYNGRLVCKSCGSPRMSSARSWLP